ncbi:hypothetical protein ACFLZQ_03155 [Thermodesulfobacteriota bacterium]
MKNNDFLQNLLESTEKTYNGTASQTYWFAGWYYLFDRYVYNQVDADISFNDYVDHRIYIT